MQRVATAFQTQRYMLTMNKAQVKQNKLNEQLTDGLAIHRASDNPIKVMRSLKFRSDYSQNNQYTQNSQDAVTWMSNTDTAIQTMSKITTRIKELTIQAANPNPEVSLEAIGTEMDKLIDNMVELGNTKVGNRFLFSGQKDATQPFTRNPDGSVSFAGDNNFISVRTQAGAVTTSEDSVNITAAELFGPDLEVFKNLNAVAKSLKDGNTDKVWLSNVGLSLVDGSHDRILKANTAIGARMSSYEMTQNILANNEVTMYTNIGNNEDINMAKASIELKTNEMLYRAALSVGSKILPPSLVDFI